MMLPIKIWSASCRPFLRNKLLLQEVAAGPFAVAGCPDQVLLANGADHYLIDASYSAADRLVSDRGLSAGLGCGNVLQRESLQIQLHGGLPHACGLHPYSLHLLLLLLAENQLGGLS